MKTKLTFSDVSRADNGRIMRQTAYAVETFQKHGNNYSIKVELRFDDECRNGHETFAMTADIRENGREYMGGCCHDEIAKHFPDLAKYIKWHLTSTDGPMHYIANAVYHASNRDYNGLLPGEPNLNPVHIGHGVRFDSVPITHHLKRSFAEFLRTRQGSGDFRVLAVPYAGTSDYKHTPQYTFIGYEQEWHACPFSKQSEAQEFADAMNKCKAEFVTFHTSWGEGKARDLDAARSCAVWPEATDEQLSLEKPELTALLEARLPALLEAFKADMLAIGFQWPVIVETANT